MTAAQSCLSLANAVDMDDIASFLSALPFGLVFSARHTNSVGASDTVGPSSVAYFLKRRFNTADLLQPQ
jgi:hypothetical protein